MKKFLAENKIENLLLPRYNNIFIVSDLEILTIDTFNILDVYFDTMEELKEFVAKL